MFTLTHSRETLILNISDQTASTAQLYCITFQTLSYASELRETEVFPSRNTSNMTKYLQHNHLKCHCLDTWESTTSMQKQQVSCYCIKYGRSLQRHSYVPDTVKWSQSLGKPYWIGCRLWASFLTPIGRPSVTWADLCLWLDNETILIPSKLLSKKKTQPPYSVFQ